MSTCYPIALWQGLNTYCTWVVAIQYSEISLSTVVYSSLLHQYIQYYFLICLFKACYLRESQVIVYTSMLLKLNEFIKKHYTVVWTLLREYGSTVLYLYCIFLTSIEVITTCISDVLFHGLVFQKKFSTENLSYCILS